MKDHCPMEGKTGVSLNKAAHQDCSCSVEKRENTPSKVSEFGAAQAAVIGKTPVVEFLAELLVLHSNESLIPNHLSLSDPHLSQFSARGPPRL
jgi:hypothetical protein